MDQILQYFRGFLRYFQSLAVAQRISLVGGAAILVGAVVFLVYVANRTDYTTLYSGLSESDQGEVAQALKAKKIPYRITSGNIEVPRDQLYETRISLASEGIPKGGVTGFEIFDQQKLGSTEFVQKINYQRALQGELARTIDCLDEVAESRVHLVLPEDSLFKEDQKPPSAAVVIKLRPGARIDQKKLQGIVNLVAATVRGLDESQISIMSTDGQVLFKKGQPDQSFQMNNAQLERKQRMEDDLRNKIQTMLEQVVGPNKVLARVNLDLDFNRVQIAEEVYNPDSSVIRSQQRSTEASEGKEPGAKGNPDVPIDLESKLLQNSPQKDASKSKQQQFNRQREIVNYEINKTSKQIVQMPGSIKKVSVAVIVDGRYEAKPDKDGKLKETYVPRPAQEMKSIEDLVKKAVGYSEIRGDQITVSNIPFATDVSAPGAIKGDNRWVRLFKTYQKVLFNAVLILVVMIFVIRPLMGRFKQMAEGMKSLPPPAAGQGVDEQLTALLLDQPGTKLTIRKQSSALVKHNPDKATEIIRSWLKDEV